MIPTIFHWVWIGPDPVPAKDLLWIKGWKDKHPDWECRLWAENPDLVRKHNDLCGLRTFPLPPLINFEVYERIEEWVTGRAILAARSDIIRMELIARHGGVYLDTDVECFKNISPLLEGVDLFISDEWGPSPGNYMFGARPNHPALWTAVRELKGSAEKMAKVNAVFLAGPQYLNPQMRKHDDCVIFPYPLFNPLCAYDDPGKVTSWPSCAYGNHRYDGKWYDRVKRDPPAEFRGQKWPTHFPPTGGGTE